MLKRNSCCCTALAEAGYSPGPGACCCPSSSCWRGAKGLGGASGVLLLAASKSKESPLSIPPSTSSCTLDAARSRRAMSADSKEGSRRSWQHGDELSLSCMVLLESRQRGEPPLACNIFYPTLPQGLPASTWARMTGSFQGPTSSIRLPLLLPTPAPAEAVGLVSMHQWQLWRAKHHVLSQLTDETVAGPTHHQGTPGCSRHQYTAGAASCSR